LETIISAAITAVVTLAVCLITNHAQAEKTRELIDYRVSELEKKLDPEQFLRSHKSYIINLSRIRRIEPYGRWTYVVHFSGRKEDALLTAEKYEEIKKRFG